MVCFLLWLVGAVVSTLMFIRAASSSSRTWANDCLFYSVVMGFTSWAGVFFLILFNSEVIVKWLEGETTLK